MSWSVTVYLGAEGSREVVLGYLKEGSARLVMNALAPGDREADRFVEIGDDFGSVLCCDLRDVLCRVLRRAG